MIKKIGLAIALFLGVPLVGADFSFRVCTDNSFAYQKLKVETVSGRKSIRLGAGALGGFHRYWAPVFDNRFWSGGATAELSKEAKCEASSEDPNLFSCFDEKAKISASGYTDVNLNEKKELQFKEAKLTLKTVKVEDHFLSPTPQIYYVASLVVERKFPEVPLVIQLSRLNCQDTPLP